MATKKHPLGVFFPGGNNARHGAQSVKDFGHIEHAAAYARALVRSGEVKDQKEAVHQADVALAELDRLERKVLIHREAHIELQQMARRPKDDGAEGLVPA